MRNSVFRENRERADYRAIRRVTCRIEQTAVKNIALKHTSVYDPAICPIKIVLLKRFSPSLDGSFDIRAIEVRVHLLGKPIAKDGPKGTHFLVLCVKVSTENLTRHPLKNKLFCFVSDVGRAGCKAVGLSIPEPTCLLHAQAWPQAGEVT